MGIDEGPGLLDLSADKEFVGRRFDDDEIEPVYAGWRQKATVEILLLKLSAEVLEGHAGDDLVIDHRQGDAAVRPHLLHRIHIVRRTEDVEPDPVARRQL